MTSTSPLTSPVFTGGIDTQLQLQRRALSRLRSGVAAHEVLTEFVQQCEKLSKTRVYVSILLLAPNGKVRRVVAPSLPIQYLGAVLTAVESEDAAFLTQCCIRQEPHFVPDIASDTYQTGWHEVALSNGLFAQWALPVFLTDGPSVGVLTCHFAQPVPPTLSDIEILALTAQTAALVLDSEDCLQTNSFAQDRQRQIFNSAIDFAIIATDLEGRVTDWNEAAHRILGWKEDEVLGETLHRIFTADDVKSGTVEAEMEGALVNGCAPDERWHLRKSGERFWAAGQMTPLKSAAGNAVGFVKVFRDRTNEKLEIMERLADTATLKSQVVSRTRERDRVWQNSLDLLLAIRSDGVLHAVNPAWTTSLGYTPDDLLGKSFEPFVHPEDVEPTRQAIARACIGPVYHFEARLRHKDGSYRWFSWRAASEDGLVYGNGRDITTEKHQAEQLAQANDARFHLALDAGEMGVWEWNLVSNELVWLYGAARVHGLIEQNSPQPMSLETYLAYLHPEDRPVLADIMLKALHDAENARAEYRVMWPDGTIHWLEARGYMLLNESGVPVHMVGVSADITKRKQAELDLKFLADVSAELTHIVDPQSIFQHLAYLAVPGFADWCAVDLLQQDGTLKRAVVAHADRAKAELALKFNTYSPQDTEAYHGPWSVIRSGQAELICNITDEMLAASIKDPERLAVTKALGLRSYIGVPLFVQGKTIGVVMYFTAESGRRYELKDIGLVEDLARRVAIALERSNLYRALQDSDQAKSVFLATLSHELRNPLAAVVNGLNLIKLFIDNKHRVEQTVAVVSRQTNQLIRLVDDLMDVSRISTGKVILQKKIVDLAEVLKDAIEISRPEIEASKHTLDVSIPTIRMELEADPARLTQIFSNLLSNAARYTNPEGRIEVSLENTANEFVTRVRDTGVGIAPEMLGKIFKMFTQVTHPVKRAHGGLGIGLSLVDGLVNLHGGTVKALSGGLGHGSEFVVCLPKNLPVEVLEGAGQCVGSEANDLSLAKRKILIVDDNQDAALTLGELLQALGQEIELAHDGFSAVEAAMTARPDVVLLDIGLPGIDGYEVARRIRKQTGHGSPVLIAVTGWGQETDKQQAYQAGFDYHLLKPVEFSKLVELLQNNGQRLSDSIEESTPK